VEANPRPTHYEHYSCSVGSRWRARMPLCRREFLRWHRWCTSSAEASRPARSDPPRRRAAARPAADETATHERRPAREGFGGAPHIATPQTIFPRRMGTALLCQLLHEETVSGERKRLNWDPSASAGERTWPSISSNDKVPRRLWAGHFRFRRHPAWEGSAGADPDTLAEI